MQGFLILCNFQLSKLSIGFGTFSGTFSFENLLSFLFELLFVLLSQQLLLNFGLMLVVSFRVEFEVVSRAHPRIKLPLFFLHRVRIS